MTNFAGVVVSVSKDTAHRFSKPRSAEIALIEGHGVEGDAHAGQTVQHVHQVKSDPTRPNLRQVHLIHDELFDGLAVNGFTVAPGELGENITTTGIDLLGLPRGTVLQFGETARIEITGLRNPCVQINRFTPGLMKALLGRDDEGNVVRKAGVMAVVLGSGPVRAGDAITVTLPPAPHSPLETV